MMFTACAVLMRLRANAIHPTCRRPALRRIRFSTRIASRIHRHSSSLNVTDLRIGRERLPFHAMR